MICFKSFIELFSLDVIIKNGQFLYNHLIVLIRYNSAVISIHKSKIITLNADLLII